METIAWVALWVGLIASIITIVTVFTRLVKPAYQQYLARKKLHNELEAMSERLADMIYSYFQTLLIIRISPERTTDFQLPIPSSPELRVSRLESTFDVIKDKLSPRQSKVLDVVISASQSCTEELKMFERQVANRETYCVQSLKNGLKLAAYAGTLVAQLIKEGDKVKLDPMSNSNATIQPYLLSLGVSIDDIHISRILETNFTNDKRYWEMQ